MNRLFAISIILIAAFIISSCADQKPTQKFSFLPSNPIAGEQVIVKYLPVLNEDDRAFAITMNVYLFNKDLDKTVGVELADKGGYWEGAFVPESNHYGALIKFKVGDDVDNNSNAGYLIKFYDAQKNVLAAANAGFAVALGGWGSYYLDMEMEKDSALSIFENAFESNPELETEFASAYLPLLNQLKDEEGKVEIERILSQVELISEKSEDDLTLLTDWYNRLNDIEKSKQFESELLKLNPQNNFFQVKEYRAIYAEPNDDKKLSMIGEFEKKYPGSKYLTNLSDMILAGYRDKGKFNLAYKFIKRNAAKVSTYRFYNISNKILEDGADTKIALEISKMGSEKSLAEIDNPSGEKPKYLSEKEWEKDRKEMAGYNLFTSAKAKHALKDIDGAYADIQQSADLTNSEDVEINELYVQLLFDKEEFERVDEEIAAFIENGKSSKKMRDLFKEIYIKRTNSDEGFEEYISEFESTAASNLMAELKKQMINMPAPQFSLKNLNGEEVSLESLKGKIVIVDFWATWCGPCRQSFPGMKKAVEAFSDDDKVEFLFINSWENVDDKIKNASDFIRKNNYPFNVLMDEENKVITDFKVSGIPTKFILDANGNIRFKSVGFDGNTDKIVDEMSSMISILKAL
ncbi:MAG: TlpA family protein disulfide reductase [Bacteroidetes bacterium]|nr:TlpA family protein disulfide reductase [Bacteroidota bacterium]